MTRISDGRDEQGNGFRRAFARFVSQPATAKPLAALRIGLCVVLLLQGFAYAPDLQTLFGPRGIVQYPVLDPADGPSAITDGVPRIQWLIDIFAPLGASGETCVRGVFLVYMTSLVGLLIGWQTPVAAWAAWLSHLTMNSSGAHQIYGVDYFANIFLFYCVVMPVGHYWSADVSAGRASLDPTAWARLSLRVFQIQMCIVYFTSAIAKSLGSQWWTGEIMWRAMNMPELAQPIEFWWLAYVPWLCPVLSCSSLALEYAYAILVWPRATRFWMALATIALHVGIGLGMGLVSFAAVMIVLTSSAFLVSGEPAGREPVKPSKEI